MDEKLAADVEMFLNVPDEVRNAATALRYAENEGVYGTVTVNSRDGQTQSTFATYPKPEPMFSDQEKGLMKASVMAEFRREIAEQTKQS